MLARRSPAWSVATPPASTSGLWETDGFGWGAWVARRRSGGRILPRLIGARGQHPEGSNIIYACMIA
jgi:hypothetical protein